jgi:hypothetical protein
VRAHADLTVIFQNGEMHVVNRGTAGEANGGIELVLGESFALHDVAVNDAIVHDDLRPAFDKAADFLAAERGSSPIASSGLIEA